MQWLGFTRILGLIPSDAKTVLLILMCVLFSYQQIMTEVDAKHEQGIKQIEQNEKKINELKESSISASEHSKAIKQTLKQMNETIKKMDSRLWKLYSKQIRKSGEKS